ncbi:YhcN/YlaJ family sporulation lipoprotein [Hazenella sp. IB182357]|uniref:YhcN/YlaJ family sporulation lipoprotein n=1 Tax=Polycladospora coralii TaxID=2771432 RepID=A0A926N969_9BACL|nr:YhcN/YlaJ family sporulation lipoprotein [Polycladospora coralii]MBD1371200.1 YhcN/YlaJ family sporulation lipoprotein [Polycladospora coralii]MBS7530142.1 YhcN/YlaJ family sporulation lipoprotein [Polycladospora coralii]
MGNNQKKMIISVLATTFLLGAVGCAKETTEEARQLDNDKYQQVRFDDYQNKERYGVRKMVETNRPERMGTNDMMARDVYTADRVSTAVKKLPSVQSAQSLVVGNNCYVAIMSKDGSTNVEMTDQMKKEVADKARAADPKIKDVYVSANPEFMAQMRSYANDLRDGSPVDGLMSNLKETIKRTFPEAK